MHRLVDSAPVLGTSSTETWDAFFSDFYLRAYADEERDAQAEADALAAARLAGRGAGRGRARRARAASAATRSRWPAPATGSSAWTARSRCSTRPAAAPAARRWPKLTRADYRELPFAEGSLRRRLQPLHLARLPRRRRGRQGAGRDPPRAAPRREARARDDAPRPPDRGLERQRLAADGGGAPAARAAHLRPGDRRRAVHPDADRRRGRRARRARSASASTPPPSCCGCSSAPATPTRRPTAPSRASRSRRGPGS